MPEGILAQLGIDASVAFAGLAGGVVGAWADGKASIATWVAYAVCGALTAIYLANAVTSVIPFITSKPTAGFIVGMCALIIVRAIIAAARKWQPNIFNGPGKAPPP
jgi:hypothetical protein